MPDQNLVKNSYYKQVAELRHLLPGTVVFGRSSSILISFFCVELCSMIYTFKDTRGVILTKHWLNFTGTTSNIFFSIIERLQQLQVRVNVKDYTLASIFRYFTLKNISNLIIGKNILILEVRTYLFVTFSRFSSRQLYIREVHK